MGSLNLHIEIDDKSGFCFGVTEAIKKAERALEEEGELYCLGEIVHNDEEVKRLERKGMKTISREDLFHLKNKTILFRAHGEPPESYDIASKSGNKIIDASCPIIKKLQNRVKKSYEAGETIVIFGKPKHPEVIALDGQIDNKAIIIKDMKELKHVNFPTKEVTLYSQTTMSLERFYDIVDYLSKQGIKVKIKDTICRKVSNRQPDIKEFCKNYDKIIFVAGKNSSNGRVLYNVCKNQNAKAYFVSSVHEIQQDWFSMNDRIGISGATSTPKWLMAEIKAYLENL